MEDEEANRLYTQMGVEAGRIQKNIETLYRETIRNNYIISEDIDEDDVRWIKKEVEESLKKIEDNVQTLRDERKLEIDSREAFDYLIGEIKKYVEDPFESPTRDNLYEIYQLEDLIVSTSGHHGYISRFEEKPLWQRREDAR